MTDDQAGQPEQPARPDPTPPPQQPERDVVAEAATPDSSSGSAPRSRRLLAAVFWLLASLSVLFGGVIVWAHQTLLTADGWGGLVEEVISQPEVVDAVSVVVVDRLSERIDLHKIVADVVPGPNIVAGAITAAVEERVVEAVDRFAESDEFAEAFVNVNVAAYDAALKVIRGGDSEALTSQDGLITLNVFPLIEGVLIQLQDSGIIDADRARSPT